MKKGIAMLLALILLLGTGCSAGKTQPGTTAPSETTVPETTAPAPTVPEPTVPETTQPLPKLETGIVQGDNIPAIVWLLSRGDTVEVTGYADETYATVNTDFGSGTLERQLLRFADETEPEPWVGYAQWNTGLYPGYELGVTAPTILKTNTKLEILEELEDCYLVFAGEETGFVSKSQVSKSPIRSGSGNSGSSTGQDGGDIGLAYVGGLRLLADTAKTGSARVRVDGAKVILRYFHQGDTVQIVTEEGFAPALPGYLTILVEDVYAYIPQLWVQRETDAPFESWDGYAGYGCRLYDNYLLRGKPVKQVYGNTALTVLWTAGDISVIRVGDTIGYAPTETLRTTPAPSQTPKDSGSGGGGGEWTPPAM